MRVGIQTWGSMGDIRPMLCLGHALQAAGHEVSIAICAVDLIDHGATCRRLGLAHELIPSAAAATMIQLTRELQVRTAMGQLITLLDRLFLPALPAQRAAAERLVARSDVVIGHFLVHPLRLAADRAGIPHLAVAFWPGMIPAVATPPWPVPQLGPFGNRALWRLARGILDRIVLPRIAQDWAAAGLPPPRDTYSDCWLSPLATLVACSPLIAPPDPSWRTVQVSGALDQLPAEREAPLPPGLEAFLAAGPPPVFMTLGSLQSLDPEGAMALFIAAARLAGCRAVIHSSSAAHPPDRSVGDLYFSGAVDHRRLLPRCALVVHHGGAGTSHAAAAAGRPSLICAFLDEQMGWGGLLQARGVAPAPVRYRRLDAVLLARLLRQTLADLPMHARARALGAALAAEDGAGQAVQAINAACARFRAQR